MSGRTKIPPKLREEVIQRDGLFCRYCGFGPMGIRWDYNPSAQVKLYNDWDQLGDRTIELDHLVPVSKGGQNTAENLVVSCTVCNLSKQNRPMSTVLREPAPLTLLPKPTASELGWQPKVYRGFP